MNSLYETLGVDKNATQAEIKAAFRAKAKANHPDTHENTEEAMRKINDAYAILKNPVKRKQYDIGGEEAANASRKDRVMQHAMTIAGKIMAENPTNVKRAMDSLLESWKRTYTYGRKQKNREITGLEAFKKRIIDAPENDVISAVVDESISKLKAELADIDEDFECRMDAIKFINEYTFAEIVQDAAEYSISVNGDFVTA